MSSAASSADSPGKTRVPTAEASALPRRSDWVETRDRVLASARDLFAERGYRGAATRALAEHAGVSLTTLRRHFPTKAELFQAAVLDPLGEFVDGYLRDRVQRGSATEDSEREMALFYNSLVSAMLGEEKLLLAAALSILDDDTATSREMRDRLDAFFDRLQGPFADKIEEYGLQIDPRLAPRVMIGSALGVMVYRSYLFPSEPRPTRNELIDELSKITIWGVAGGPDSPFGRRRR